MSTGSGLEDVPLGLEPSLGPFPQLSHLHLIRGLDPCAIHSKGDWKTGHPRALLHCSERRREAERL